MKDEHNENQENMQTEDTLPQLPDVPASFSRRPVRRWSGREGPSEGHQEQDNQIAPPLWSDRAQGDSDVWETRIVEVPRFREVVEYYDVVMPRIKIVEIPQEIETIEEVPVEHVVWEYEEQVTIEYDIQEKIVEVPTEKVVEIIEWVVDTKEVEQIQYETVVETVYEDEPQFIERPEIQYEPRIKHVPTVKIVEREVFEEEIVEVPLIKTIEKKQTKIVEQIVEKPVVEYIPVEKVIETPVIKYVYQDVEKHVPSEPHIIEVVKEEIEVEYDDVFEDVEHIEIEVRETPVERPQIIERIKEIEVQVFEPDIQEIHCEVDPQKFVQHPLTGKLISYNTFLRNYPEYDIVSSDDI